MFPVSLSSCANREDWTKESLRKAPGHFPRAFDEARYSQNTTIKTHYKPKIKALLKKIVLWIMWKLILMLYNEIPMK